MSDHAHFDRLFCSLSVCLLTCFKNFVELDGVIGEIPVIRQNAQS